MDSGRLRTARLACCLMATIGGTVSASANDVQGCLVFRERGFNGDNLPVSRNARLPALTGTWDNAVSSVRVAQGCLLVAFRDKDFRGPSEAFGPGDYSELPKGWDDEFSSLQCNCR